MYELTIEDFIRIVVKSILLTMIIAPLFIGLFYLIHINIEFAYYISDITNIPRDLTLSVASAGFANNIIILSTVFEVGLISWIIYKISQTSIYKNIKYFIISI